MRIVYLKAPEMDTLKEDIQKVLPEYNGEVEFTNGINHCHTIGHIPISINEDGSVNEFSVEVHANLLITEDFEGVFEFEITPPNNPIHQFA